MNIMQLWKQNILMLQPQNAKKIGLLAIKLYKDLFFQVVFATIIVSSIFWFFPGFLFSFFFVSPFWYGILFYWWFGFKIILYITLAAVFRSSVTKKTIQYYINLFFPRILSLSVGILFYASLLSSLKTIGFSDSIFLFIDVIFLLLGLFFFDAEYVRKSSIMQFINKIDPTFKMIVYNVPIFLAIGILFFVKNILMMLLLIFFWYMTNIFPAFNMLFSGFFLLFDYGLLWYMCALVTTIYNMLIYDQSKLYFKH